MARYVGFLVVAIEDFQNLQPIVLGILEECNCEVIFNTGNYIMARELPGQVSFSQLAIAEVTFNLASITENTIRIDIIFKNEVLPAHKDNHCRQVFDLFFYWAINSKYWKIIESMIPDE
ncbi:MAG: hypothetical protein F6K35_26055 [Okeania sp. SIO2H7]|nr:hypothetical protein [Okeania sp. SIO2H7]